MARKPRRYHQNGEKSLDLCPVCFSYGCDPFAMSHKFIERRNERLRKGLCVACGKPKQYCSCKSSLTKDVKIRTHNNKKLAKAQAYINAVENALKAWEAIEDDICEYIGDDVYGDIHYSMSKHLIPDIPLSDVKKNLGKHASQFDFSKVEVAWMSENEWNTRRVNSI